MKNLIKACKFEGPEYVRGGICICLLAGANDPSPQSSPVRWPNDGAKFIRDTGENNSPS